MVQGALMWSCYGAVRCVFFFCRIPYLCLYSTDLD